MMEMPNSTNSEAQQPRPGVRLRETLRGGFALDTDDPREGVRASNSQSALSVLELAILVPDVRRFVEEPASVGAMRARVQFPALGDSMNVTEGTFNVEGDDGEGRKTIQYGLQLAWQGKPHYLLGQKELRAPSGIDRWLQATTLTLRLHEGEDVEKPIIGAGVLNLSSDGLHELFQSIEAINPRSTEEANAIITYFGRHLMGGLYEQWVQHRGARANRKGLVTRLRQLLRY